MKIIKPLYLNDKNLISYLLAPLTIFTILINFGKNFLIRKKYKIKIICIGNIYIGGTGKTSLSIQINKILKNKFKTVFIKKNSFFKKNKKKIIGPNENQFRIKKKALS